MDNRNINSHNEEWHDQLFTSLEQLFVSNDRQSILYGPGHALAVEKMLLEILDSPDYRDVLQRIDAVVLRTAALLHDIGFTSRKDNWSLIQSEHVPESSSLAHAILSQNVTFRDNPDLIEPVLWLIENHDHLVHSFPLASNRGRPILSKRVMPSSDLHLLLVILQEADMLVHATDKCVEELSQEWLNRGIPMFGQDGPRLTTWRWMDSIVGNLRLLSKCVLVSAQTQKGRQEAYETYDRLEDYIRHQCGLAEVPYEPEICTPFMRPASLDRLSGRSYELEIVAAHSWDETEQAIRSTLLLGDSSTQPYKYAQVQNELISLDAVTPMALYVLRNRLEETLELHDAFMATYGFGILDLPGWLEFRYNSSEVQSIIPPIVEDYTEMSYTTRPRLLGLVDGLHRCTIAKALALSQTRFILMSNVPYPLVPLPVTWDDVVTYEPDAPPVPHMKRRYRYLSLTDFPNEKYDISGEVTEENFQYFFYRDLSHLGSLGRRDFHEYESKRAH